MDLSIAIVLSTLILCITIVASVYWLSKSVKLIIDTIFMDIKKLEKYVNVHVEKTVDVTVKNDENKDIPHK